ncbi:hypothetical protein BDV3_005097 [Batrachochytrium dendrobatidis]|uniref:chitin deacetylase n=1 Tax=Batrachochytrium dendrobatidis (strain JEL423) TaxID=403673 RepID=A0A177WLR7_BATDL|nr:chitin deacetylase [Batrachochytrium dendrobatidis]KAK5670701.1 chitin deacetylase [Batrachochytrium dendrobatidis]OAJ40635.1 hypothetical protein BDEG_24342 [Batrachochytrium dendrobatidis JEL423]
MLFQIILLAGALSTSLADAVGSVNYGLENRLYTRDSRRLFRRQYSDTYPGLDKLTPGVSVWSDKFEKSVPNTSDGKTAESPESTKCKDADSWALTFDDGPSDPTPKLLDELKKRDIKVTFFVVGSRVEQHPEHLKRAYAEGHQIGIHTWSHPSLSKISVESVISEIMYTARIIKETIGVTPTAVRPPYGDVDSRVRTIIRNMGMSVVLWTVDSGDSGGSTTVADTLKKAAEVTPKSGHISLEHDLFSNQAGQAPAAMDAIKAAGYKLVRIDDCLGVPAYNEGLWSGLPLPAQGPGSNTTTTADGKTNSTKSEGELNGGSAKNSTTGIGNSTTNGNATANATATAAAKANEVPNSGYGTQISIVTLFVTFVTIFALV